MPARLPAADRLTGWTNDSLSAFAPTRSARHLPACLQGASVSSAVAWALQPGSVAESVRAELAAYLSDDGGVSLREMVWDKTKVGALGVWVDGSVCGGSGHMGVLPACSMPKRCSRPCCPRRTRYLQAPHCGLPGAFINALYCAKTSGGWVHVGWCVSYF